MPTLLLDGVVDPALNAARLDTIVVVMPAAVAPAIAHVRDEEGVAGPGSVGVQEDATAESPEQT